jgi:hypothetical protein
LVGWFALGVGVDVRVSVGSTSIGRRLGNFTLDALLCARIARVIARIARNAHPSVVCAFVVVVACVRGVAIRSNAVASSTIIISSSTISFVVFYVIVRAF